MSKYKILLADDDVNDHLHPTQELLKRWGYEVDAVASGDEAIERIQSGVKDYAVAILDYKMPDKTGTETATVIRTVDKEVILLIYTNFPSYESSKAAIRAGVLNFLEKDEGVEVLKSAVERACQEYEKVRTVKPPLEPSEISRLLASIGIVGRSESMAQIARRILKLREDFSSALIIGESGTGKELIAKALHTGHPSFFMPVNCASLRDGTLLESELFGHEKGAFTGALARKVGIFEAAKGGTVFLDELHTLDLSAQGRLLRVLANGAVRRVGAIHEEKFQFKVVAACKPIIEDMVKNGTFLEDLYFRLNPITFRVPPLRERPEDIEPLVLHFCEEYFKKKGVRRRFLASAITAMEQLHWTGNVRELEGMVSEKLMTHSDVTINDSVLDGRLANPVGTYEQLEQRQEQERRRLIQGALQSSKSMRQAARRVGG